MMAVNPLELLPTKHAISLFDEFKKFAFKGNMIDMAIGIVIGAAFGRLVESLVKNLVMPLVSVILPGDGGYVNWAFTLNGVKIPFGAFIGELVNFLILAIVVFIFMVKFLTFVVRRREEPAPPPAPTKTEELLIEIRDALKKPA